MGFMETSKNGEVECSRNEEATNTDKKVIINTEMASRPQEDVFQVL